MYQDYPSRADGNGVLVPIYLYRPGTGRPSRRCLVKKIKKMVWIFLVGNTVQISIQDWWSGGVDTHFAVVMVLSELDIQGTTIGIADLCTSRYWENGGVPSLPFPFSCFYSLPSGSIPRYDRMKWFFLSR